MSESVELLFINGGFSAMIVGISIPRLVTLLDEVLSLIEIFQKE